MQDAPFIDDSSHWTPLRRELLKWFRDNAAPLAEAYEGAIRLVDDGDFPGRVHFIAHAIRDISDRLVYVLDPQLKATRVQYENEMDRVEKQWPQLISVKDTNDAATEAEIVPIDYKVASMIDSLVTAHRERRQRPSNYELLFRFLMRKEPLQAEVNQRLVMDFKKMRKYFMDLTHLRHKKGPPVDESELQAQFKNFEGMLHSFVGNFFTGKSELDEILRQANQHNQVEAAMPLLSSPQHEAYFFAQLENPHWITPLQERGMFAYPPKVEHVKGGGIRYPIWPASKYLARMAAHVPSEVAAIFKSFETDNVSVIGDMLDATLAMPAKVAATLVPAICPAAVGGTLWLHFDDVSDLCVRLADGGEMSAAMALADALAPRFEEGQEKPSGRDEYRYKAGLKRVVPALVGREPREFLAKLCDWLKVSVDAKKHVNPNSGVDYSYMWRPAIEEHEQNLDYKFAGAMVGVVRQGLEQAIRDGQLSLEETLKIIDPHPYLVFRRIEIHLVNEFAEQNAELARRIMMDHGLFVDYRYKHEYAMLVGRRLNLLTAEERNTWFGWVDTGPNMSGFNESIKERRGRDATDEDQQNRKEYWQFEKLHCVRTHLESQRRKFYEAMLAKHGEPELADLNSRIRSGRWGNTSPMTVADLAELTFERAVAKMTSWEPEERQFIGPGIEGLASTFEQYVATDPVAFSAQADALVGCQAIYVRTFIQQMAEAVKAGCEINVSAVLKLCRWVLGRPLGESTTPEQGHGVLVDTDWQWTRDQISRFVQNICQTNVDDAPKYPLNELRELMWELVNTLCRDRAKSYIACDISQDDPRLRDYLDLGINSSRGRAVEAALEYARWVANHVKKAEGNHEIIPGGFESMREVREMLEWQITPGNRSFEALAVIGSRLDLIYWIDKDWLAKNAGRLFRLEGIADSPPMAHGWAAWNAFLVWVRPYIEFYGLFKQQFAYAVVQCAQVRFAEQTHEEPMNHLSEHLMILYGRGQLGLDEDEGLLRRFLTDSQPDIRRHAIGFVGRSLEGEEQISEEIVGRFKTLWDVYWSGEGKKDAEQKPDAWIFGPWFSSGIFPEQWALEQLESVVSVTPTPEPDHAIVDQLAKTSQANIVKAIRILDQMVRGDREGWRIHGWLDSVRRILELAMNAGGDARTQAVQVIDYLGRRGHTGFGELLNLGGATDTV